VARSDVASHMEENLGHWKSLFKTFRSIWNDIIGLHEATGAQRRISVVVRDQTCHIKREVDLKTFLRWQW